MKTNIERYRTIIERKKGVVAEYEKTVQKKQKQVEQKTQQLHQHEKALEIVKEVGRKTQEKLQFHISDITSLALEAIFEQDAYLLKMMFVDRRNRNECDLFFERDGNLIDPKNSSGVGAVDVASFALRKGLISLS